MTGRTSVRSKIRAIIYIRVSQEREEGYSPEQQLHACETFAKAMGIEIIDVVEDLDLSGRGFAKRKVMSIIKRVEAGEANCVIVWKWSRFGRNIELARQHIRILEEAGGELKAATEDFDTKTTAGRFSRDQMLLIAEFQSGIISDGWKETHERRFRNGQPHTGQERFGYKRCDDCTRSELNPRAFDKCSHCKGVLQINPTTGPYLAEAYDRYTDVGEAAASIVRDFTKRGIRTINGNFFTPMTLLQTMDTGFAAGLLRARSPEMRLDTKNNKPESYDLWTTGKQKALIEMDLWERYKAKRRQATKNHDRAPKYSVSGFLRCQEHRVDGELCNSRMHAASLMKTTNGYRKVFRCPGVTNKSCAGASISLDKVERLVFEWLVTTAKDSNMAQVTMARLQAVNQSEEHLAMKQAELKSIKNKLSKALDGYLADLISPEDYTDKKDELEAQKEIVSAEIALLEDSIRSNKVPHRHAVIKLVELWPKMTADEKRLALRRVVDRIEVHKAQGKGGRARPVIISRWDARRQAVTRVELAQAA